MRVLIATLSVGWLVACGGDTSQCKNPCDGAAAQCEVGKNQCDSPTSIQECVGGAWQAARACSTVCEAKGQLSGGCGGDPAKGADCLCGAACKIGETKCEGFNLRTCTGSQWEVASCDTVCKTAGYPKAKACAFDSAKNAEACSCEVPAGWGESCSASKICPTGFVCVSYSGKSFCTQNCAPTGSKCTGTPPGSYGGCLIKMSDGTLACAFVCKLKTTSYTCPGAMTCSSTEDPPGSGQYPCLP